MRMNPNIIVMALAKTLDAYESKEPLFSCQGQAMDGYSALAQFIAIAKQARELRDAEDSPKDTDN